MDGLLQFSLFAAFLAGVSGGAHCAAMCGPLIGIACGSGRGQNGQLLRGQWLRRALAYNAGRVLTYAVAGAATGAAGAAGISLRAAPLTQQTLLAVMSLSLVLLAAYVAGFAPLVNGVERAGSVVWSRVGTLAGRFLPATTPGRAFGLGLVFGWMPCGMVYMVMIAALATADPLHGALVMAAFGLGTLPNVLAISVWFRHFAVVKGRLARSLVALVIAAVGTWGILQAVSPATASALGQCLSLPGLGAIFGGQ